MREKILLGAGGLMVALVCIAVIVWGVLGIYRSIAGLIGG